MIDKQTKATNKDEHFLMSIKRAFFICLNVIDKGIWYNCQNQECEIVEVESIIVK